MRFDNMKVLDRFEYYTFHANFTIPFVKLPPFRVDSFLFNSLREETVACRAYAERVDDDTQSFKLRK